MSEPVLISRDGDVGTVTLNRPEAYNAITIELARSLARALDDLVEDVNVIVIRGAGGNFCVGGDFNELERLRGQGEGAMRELFESFREACDRIVSLPVPVIAAVAGYAMAGGFELMQASDVALVRSDARIGDNHSNFGQVPGGGSSQRLPRLVGRQRALGLILSGDRLTGEEAERWGLAYRSFAPDEFDAGVAEFAAKLAGKSREALARSKWLVHAGLELSLAEGLDTELRVVLEHLTGDAAGQGIARFAGRGGGSGT
jgi:enoyl-CoA hydratase/carnithine racemase